MPRRLGARLGAAFGAVLLVTLLVAGGALALLSMVRQLNVASADETTRLVQVRQWTEQVRINLERALQVTRLEGIAGGDEAVRSRMGPVTGRLVEDMTTTAKVSADLQATLLAGAVPQDVRSRVLAVDQRRKEFVGLRARLNDELQMGEDPNKVEAQLRPAADAMVTALADLSSTLERRSADATRQLEQQASLAMLLLAAGGAVAVSLGALLAWRMTRALTRPLADAAAVACGIAAGDLTQAVQVTRDDELGAMLESLGTMQSQLAAMIEGIHESTGAILRASDDIAGSSQDLDARTAEAARFLGNTSSSMASLSDSVQHSAQAAASAGQMAAQAAAVAQRGGEVVARVVTTMSDIQSSARRIADIRASSTASPSRPTSWRSTPRWKRLAPATRAAASPSSPVRCGQLAQRTADRRARDQGADRGQRSRRRDRRHAWSPTPAPRCRDRRQRVPRGAR
jgi:HAMP domain-containing protein